MRESPALVESRRFGTRTVPALRPLGWLMAGWRDFMRCPLPGLLQGLGKVGAAATAERLVMALDPCVPWDLEIA